jgi:hypothetical protein
MPNVDIEVDEFLWSCDSRDIQELIQALIEDGHLKNHEEDKNDKNDYAHSAPEAIFEEALSKLRGKWNMLSSEEEQMIIKISTRF